MKHGKTDYVYLAVISTPTSKRFGSQHVGKGQVHETMLLLYVASVSGLAAAVMALRLCPKGSSSGHSLIPAPSARNGEGSERSASPLTLQNIPKLILRSRILSTFK